MKKLILLLLISLSTKAGVTSLHQYDFPATTTYYHYFNGFTMGCYIHWPQNHFTNLDGSEWIRNPCYIDAPSGAPSGTVGYDYEANGAVHPYNSTTQIPVDVNVDTAWSYTGSAEYFATPIYTELYNTSFLTVYWDDLTYEAAFWYMGGGGNKTYVHTPIPAYYPYQWYYH